MRKGYVVKEKGYEYNDNWYDHDPNQDVYTKLFNDVESALKYAKEFTADFIANKSVYDYFNEQPYLGQLVSLVGDNFKTYDINSKLFDDIWSLIKNDIAVVLEAEILEDEPVVVSYSDGTKMYFKDNKLHRLGGPAIERADGTWVYYYDGKKHRADGQAEYSEYNDEGFYLEGKYYWDMDEYKKNAAIWIQNHRESQINNIVD